MRILALWAAMIGGVISVTAAVLAARWIQSNNPKYSNDGPLYPGVQRSQVLPQLLKDQQGVAAMVVSGTAIQISTMKLQRLCFYSQGWHLAWRYEALFEEPIQAWRMGPVCPALDSKHKGKASVSEWPEGSASELTPAQKKTIEIIVDFYRPYNGFELGKRTH